MKNVALALCLSLAATTVTLASPNVQFVDVYGQTATIAGTYYNGSVSAGIYHIKVDGVTQNSFCIDLADPASSSAQPYSIVNLSSAPDAPLCPMGAAKATAIGKLWAMDYSPTMTQNQAAALQLAIWDCVTDLDYSVTSGNFRVTGTDYGAQALLNSLQTYNGPVANMQAYTSVTYQDYANATVPAPGAMALGSLGMMLVGWLRRRRAM